MADGKEHRQQEAPQRGAHRKVQREVIGAPEPVTETRERNDADRERDSADDGVRDDLLGVDQHAEQGDEGSRESGERERYGHELCGQATVHAHDPGKRAGDEQDAGGDIRCARHLWTVHPAWKCREQETEDEGGQRDEKHQERVRPDRCDREIERKQRKPV